LDPRAGIIDARPRRDANVLPAAGVCALFHEPPLRLAQCAERIIIAVVLRVVVDVVA
jgi:hypothetical protein